MSPVPGHYAVAVGINHYVGFNPLNHAVRDARAVADWLEGTAGASVTRVLGRQGPPRAALVAAKAKPLREQVYGAIEAHRESARALVDAGTVRWEDTRLYLYVSGHGVAPTPDDAALLTAEARRANAPKVSLRAIREFLLTSQEFREVIILADCCRDVLDGIPADGPTWTTRPSPGRPPVRTLFWRATSFNLKSFEAAAEEAEPEAQHGYFTRALLDSLAALQAQPGDGIDDQELAAEVSARLVKLLPEGRKQVPELPVDGGQRILIWRNPAAPPPAAAPAPGPGFDVDLRAGEDTEIIVRSAAGKVVGRGTARLATRLPAGRYTFVFSDADGERRLDHDLVAPFMHDQGRPDSVAPIQGSDGSNETHQATAEWLALGPGQPTRLAVMVRYRREDPAAVPATLDGVRVNKVQLPAAPIPAGMNVAPGRLAGGALPLPPGPCVVSFPSPDGAPKRHLPLWLPRDFVTYVFAPPDARGRAAVEGASVHMRPFGRGVTPGGDQESNLVAEYALLALTRGQGGFTRSDLMALLHDKFQNPMLGLLGAHLLLLDAEVDWGMFGEVFFNLAQLLPGHPDLLGVYGQAARRAAGRVPHPGHPPLHPGATAHLPTLWRSWEGILWLDQNGGGAIVAGSPAERFAPNVGAAGSWLVTCAFPEDPGIQPDHVSRVRGWARAAGNRDAAHVAAGTRLPMSTVRAILGADGG